MTSLELIIAIVFIILQLIDGFSTLHILRHGGQELNPLLVKLSLTEKLPLFGKWTWIAIAKAIPAALVTWMAWTTRIEDQINLYILQVPMSMFYLVMIVMYGAVIYHNLSEIAKMNGSADV